MSSANDQNGLWVPANQAPISQAPDQNGHQAPVDQAQAPPVPAMVVTIAGFSIHVDAQVLPGVQPCVTLQVVI
jgi:hypothetical protein